MEHIKEQQKLTLTHEEIVEAGKQYQQQLEQRMIERKNNRQLKTIEHEMYIQGEYNVKLQAKQNKY
jgi:hypothetical protein